MSGYGFPEIILSYLIIAFVIILIMLLVILIVNFDKRGRRGKEEKQKETQDRDRIREEAKIKKLLEEEEARKEREYNLAENILKRATINIKKKNYLDTIVTLTDLYNSIMNKTCYSKGTTSRPLLLCHTLTLRGNAKRFINDIDGAFEDYNEAISVDESFPEAFMSRAELYMLVGDPQNALLDLDKAKTLFLSLKIMDKYQYAVNLINKIKMDYL